MRIGSRGECGFQVLKRTHGKGIGQSQPELFNDRVVISVTSGVPWPSTFRPNCLVTPGVLRLT